MKCRACETEIAEKALICFRCGAAVEEAVTQPAQVKQFWRPAAVYVVLAIVVLIAIAVVFVRLGSG
ncbi:MAG: hypothetical protein EXQ55_03585 [Acidobacteria bacterium]|nr:hypothetical protein [Acidobacteriota bacterium]